MVLQTQCLKKIAFPATSICSVCVPVKRNLHYTMIMQVQYLQPSVKNSYKLMQAKTNKINTEHM